MTVVPIVNPADFLPVPLAVEALDYEALFAAWKVKFKALWPDYNVDSLETDPGVIIAEAYAYLRLTDRARINDVYSALRLARAKGTDLDGLAADRGIKRLVYVPATATAPAVMEGDISLLLRCWLVMQTWGSGSRFGVEYWARTLGRQYLADAHVIDYPGEGRMTCVLLPVSGLDDATKATVLTTVSNGVLTRRRRPGSVWIDTVYAEIITVDYVGTLKVRKGASQSALLAAATAGLTSYMSTRRRIGKLVPVSAMEAQQYSTSVVEVEATSPSADIVPTELQAAELGTVTITVQAVND